MFDLFRRVRIHVCLTAVLTVILGLILLVAPGTAIRTVFTLIGWVLVISGIVALLTSAMSKGQPVAQGDLVLGLIQLASGLVVLLRPGFLMSFVGIVVGFLMLIHGVRDIQGAREGKALGYDYRFPLAVGIITLILGIIVMIDPFGTASGLLRIAGIFLLLDGVSDILLILKRGR